MPMGDLDNMFPKKSRESGLILDGLCDSNRIFVRSYFNQLCMQGVSEDEAECLANEKARELAFLDAQMAESLAYAEKKQKTDPRPPRNIDGDVTVKRMMAFLKFMNAYSADLTDNEILDAIENEWLDVIDIGVTRWDSDCYGLTLYLIGEGKIVFSTQAEVWLLIEEQEPLNTPDDHSDINEY